MVARLPLLRTLFLSGAALIAVAPLPACAQQPSDLRGQAPPAHAIWLDSLNLRDMTCGWGQPHAGRSVEGNPLTLGGEVYGHGVGTHAESEFRVDLKGAATRFVSMVGVDDEKKGQGSVTFTVWLDGKRVAGTGVLHGGNAPQLLSADLTGARRMRLAVGDGGDGIDSDHADWAGAAIVLAPGAAAKPTAETPVIEPARMIVPPPDPRPAIHNPHVVGATPGRPFLFLIPATGERPLTYSAADLPAGLTLDPQTGIISGSLVADGVTSVGLTVRGPAGVARDRLTIIGGDHKLARTPPMGWNSWNVWAGNVTAANVRDAADAMVKSGLAAHGFQYVNIDDTWEGSRDANGEITTNAKFGDMKALADYVHSKGLRLGIYSSPGPTTCAGFPASYQHEDQDAATYANWGIDYLKYDWCSYGGIAPPNPGVEELEKPYRVMRASLDKASRDIVFSLCQYGMGDVWKWGADVGGNCWRTTGDINDSWGSLHSIYTSQNGHEVYAAPGHWNDPDMLVVGKVGWGNPHPSHLTPNEQILHISMWCLLSSPLLIGCDMSQMDPFTVALLSNDEALDVNQDPLGKPAGRRSTDGEHDVWARPLADGTMAVGLINGGADPATIRVSWALLGRIGRQRVRDIWLHKDLGLIPDGYAVAVPAHGAVLLKVGMPNKSRQEQPAE